MRTLAKRISWFLALVLSPSVGGQEEAPLAQWQQQAAQGGLEEVVEGLRNLRAPEPDALRLLAWLESCAGRQEEALRALDRLLARSPGDLDALQRRADAYWAQGRFQAASAAYQGLAGIDPDPERQERYQASMRRLATLTTDQSDLRHAMERLQRWYGLSGTMAVLALLWGGAGFLRVGRSR